MKTTDKIRRIVDDRLAFQKRSYISDFKEGNKLTNNQQFVVPWQMPKTDERKILEKLV